MPGKPRPPAPRDKGFESDAIVGHFQSCVVVRSDEAHRYPLGVGIASERC
jgi:hypothetical protein